MRAIVCAAAAALFACAGKTAPTNAERGVRKIYPIPVDLRDDVQRSIDYGTALYLQDKAASRGTDVMFEHVPRPQDEGLGGYLAIRDGTADGKPTTLPATWSVFFYTNEDQPRVKFLVHVPFSNVFKPTFEKFDPPRHDEAVEYLAKIRDAAVKAAAPFKQKINPAILPAGTFGQEPGDSLVELLAGTEKTNTVVLGKHFRVIVSRNGEVRSVTPLSKDILELSTVAPNGARPEAIVVSELVADYPLETHYLASLQAKLPLYVGNARGTWLVDGEHGRIDLIEPAKADK
jgi:hypothetical protein